MERYNRVKSLLEGELITITDIEKYKSLIEDITEDQFEVHVEALKEMTADGNSYEFTPVEKEDGTVTLDIKELTETEDNSDESNKDETEEKKEETEDKSTESNKDETEEKKEEKSEFSALNTKLAKLLELVQSGQSKYESFETDFKTFKDDILKSFKVVKKKQKEIQDNEYNISKALPLDHIIRKSEGEQPKTLRQDIGNILADKCTGLYRGRDKKKGESE